MLKVALVIAFKNFRDEEFFHTQTELLKAGIEVIPVSNRSGSAQGSEGGEVEITHSLQDLDLADYEMLVLIGGRGALKYLDNSAVYQLLREAIQQKKIVGAICIAPLILARAGILEGKEATVWSSSLSQQSVRELESLGAHYLQEPVVEDGLLITANGPSAAKLFGQRLIKVLTTQRKKARLEKTVRR